jgi:L,D-transpeptidase ErfK/SrfK
MHGDGAGAQRARGSIESGARRAGLALLLALCAAAAQPLPSDPSPSDPPAAELGCGTQVVGGARDYGVREGDSLTSVSSRFGEDIRPLAAANGLAVDARLRIGQLLHIENLHIVPAVTDAALRDAILINVPQRMLFQFRDGQLAGAHPVGLGRPTWRTPTGEFRIDARETDKTWHVPTSIQEEMRRAGKPVLTRVPPGPQNPLGRHWLGLAPTTCGIHGTIAPASVYRFQTHGCIRLHPDDVAEIFARSSLEEAVRIVYFPLLVARLPDGRMLLEVHSDVYRQAEPARAAWQRLGSACGMLDGADPARVEQVITASEGLARDVRVMQ